MITEVLSGALQSQLVGGGLVLMLTGGVMALLRQVPARMWSALTRQFIISVEVLNTDPAYEWVARWLDAQPLTKKSRLLTASAVFLDNTTRVRFTPAPGLHVFWYKGRLVWLNRERTESAPIAGAMGAPKETITMRILGRDQKIVRELFEEARMLSYREDNKIGVYINIHDYWRRLHAIEPRPIDSVFLPDNIVETVTADIKDFFDAEEFYQERGVPWRRGYLFSGPPGTGKSSLLSALAGELRCDLYILNLTADNLSDDRLLHLLLDIPEHSLVLLEDIDAIVKGREVKNSESDTRGSSVTFTGLLNALDGVASKSGLVTIMTTNHVENLDPALIRPGRVDLEIAFKSAKAPEIHRLFKHFYKDADEALSLQFANLAEGAGMSMAEAQQHLLRNKNTPYFAVAALMKKP